MILTWTRCPSDHPLTKSACVNRIHAWTAGDSLPESCLLIDFQLQDLRQTAINHKSSTFLQTFYLCLRSYHHVHGNRRNGVFQNVLYIIVSAMELLCLFNSSNLVLIKKIDFVQVIINSFTATLDCGASDFETSGHLFLSGSNDDDQNDGYSF
jgi:hypothetical protein